MSIFTHACVGTNDIVASAKFYDTVLGALGIANLGESRPGAVMYGKAAPQFFVLTPLDGGSATVGNGGTIGFAAETRAQVDAFHAAGLSHGGVDAGSPGPRPHIIPTYAAYLRDPVGNKICAYCFAAE